MLSRVLIFSLGAALASSFQPCKKESCSPTNCAVNVPTFNQLPNVALLNDAFTFYNGTKVQTEADWACRKVELMEFFYEFELGPKQPAPSDVSGTVSTSAITVNAGDGTTSISFTATVQLPTTGSAPYPSVIGVGGCFLNSQALLNKGIAIINFPNDDVAQQNSAQSRGIGKYYTLYGASDPAGAMMAWAWGVSRMLDVMQADPSGLFDMDKIGATGCSRNGKGSLVVSAFDERIALALIQESGSGGSASWRISDWQGTTVQTLGEIIGENVWFGLALNQFSGYTTKLPMDHHLLLALMIPRAALVIENTGMVWLGNVSTWDNSNAARQVFSAFGLENNLGVSQVGNHNHCAFPAEEQPDVDAFVDAFLLGQSGVNTTIVHTDGAFTYNASWYPYPIPSIQG
jgi:hypothetical protein